MTPQDPIATLDVWRPDIAFRVRSIWGDPVCSDYLKRLLIPEGIDSPGLEPHVFSALACLQEMHELHFPSAEKEDVWMI